jgi:hypothetical protein
MTLVVPNPTTLAELDAKNVFDKLADGKCPDCPSQEFYMGPHGGASQNITCTRCSSKFCVAPFDDGWLGTPMMAVRI